MDTGVQKYRAFVEAVDAGSFTKAARKLDYSQSGISRMIADLERDWDVRLLERNRRGVNLTSEGQELLPHARRLCHEFDAIQTRVQQLRGMESGLVRIGAFTSVATHWLPSIIGRFQERFPNIDYELITGDYPEIEQLIWERRLDCGFVTMPVHHDVAATLLKRDEMVAVLPHGNPLANLPVFPVSAFRDYPFLALKSDGGSEALRVLESAGIDVHPKIFTFEDHAIMAMAEAGLGCGILPSLVTRRMPYDVTIKSLDVPAYRDLAIAVRSEQTMSAATRNFLSCVQECIPQL